MTLDLEAIEKRCEAATEGPWVFRSVDDGVSPRYYVTRKHGVDVPPKFYIAFLPEMSPADSRADGNFIACAHQDIPALIKEIRRLREGLGDAEDVLTKVMDCGQRELDDDLPHMAGEIIPGIRELLADTPQEGSCPG